MHLIFVTSLVPDGAPSTGYEIANAAILGALRRGGARVTVMGFCRPGQSPADPENTIVLGETEVSTANASQLQKLQWLAQAMASGQTVSSAKLRIVSEAQIRAQLDKIAPFDGFVLNAVQMAGAYPSLFTSRPWLYVAHNVEYVSALQNAEAARGSFMRYLFQREARVLRGLEQHFSRGAVQVLVLSDDDACILSGDAGHQRFATAPLITRETTPDITTPGEKTCDAALIGTWTWAPNRIGLDWFLDQVVPGLPADFSVHIAGALPDDIRSDHPGIRLVGRVPDAAQFVQQAAVVPLASRAGTGVQLKTIETFEMGLPCVATSSALRGINYLPENCILADDPDAFARAMVQQVATGKRVNGSAFHAAQKTALDKCVADALASLAQALQNGLAA